ncbi:MAG: OmpA family protein [Bacteroidales bacterium]|nr:OmpA family protein [Bacteroidales bacterium]MBN2758244.1 OmpA family protein [Bacteroidales bacterium]
MKIKFIAVIYLLIAFQTFSQDVEKIENLGFKVNSNYHDLAPIISADGKILYFVRAGHPQNTMFKKNEDAQDIWFSELDKSGEWGLARHGASSINTRYSNSVCWVSPDGNRILIVGGYDKKGKFTERGFSMLQKTETDWSEPIQLDIDGFDEMNKGVFYGATLTNDSKTILLYFSKIEASTINDIYVSFLKEENKWTKPVNIGQEINTKKWDELTPFIAADGVTLYFASDRKGGLGGLDIWKSKRLDDSWRKWTEPVNMGAPINTKAWDAFFTLDANSAYAYMVTTKNSKGGADIVRIGLKAKDKPNPVVLIYGNVYNAKTKEPISAGLQYEILPEGIIAGYAYSNPTDGAYKIVIPYGKNYSFMANAQNFLSVSENLNLDTASTYKEIKRDLYLVPIEIGQTIRLNNIFFDFNSQSLKSESFPELNRVVKVLNENPNLEIEMAGHTDNVGIADANLKLSEERAHAVKNYLVSKNIDENRIISKGYGESKPVAENNNDEGRQLNRRVEFTILKK